jgi:cytochrome c oxidase subunit 2
MNEAWFEIDADKTGTFRGQCAELCGRDHGFMPIVLEVKSKADFEQWLRDQKQAQAPAAAPTPGQPLPAQPGSEAAPTASITRGVGPA